MRRFNAVVNVWQMRIGHQNVTVIDGYLKTADQKIM